MNIENAKTFLGQLQRLPDEKFVMNEWIIHPEDAKARKEENAMRYPDDRSFERAFPAHVRALSCGTVGCGAGWCCLLNNLSENNPEYTARVWLDLHTDEAHHLFLGRWSDADNLSEITRSDFIQQLSFLITLAEGGSPLPSY